MGKKHYRKEMWTHKKMCIRDRSMNVIVIDGKSPTHSARNSKKQALSYPAPARTADSVSYTQLIITIQCVMEEAYRKSARMKGVY